MIVWDKAKREKNLKAHDIDLAEVGCVFDAPMVTVEDERDDSVRVSSCRYGDKHETHAYFEALGL